MRTRSSSLGPGWAALLLGLAAAAFWALQRGVEAQRLWRQHGPPLTRAIPEGLSRVSLMAALAGESRVAADWAYIDCLQYVGDPVNLVDGRYKRTLPLYRQVLWLDPSFGHAGREGVSMLGWYLRRPDDAESLIADARRWAPEDARYPVYLAALGFQKKLDPVGVVETLRDEVKRPDAPEMLLRMVGNVYMKAEDWDGAITYWSWVLKRAKEPDTRSEARRSIRTALEQRDKARHSAQGKPR